MTLWSFRVSEEDAVRAQRWAERLGVGRSELIREALRRHLTRLASEIDADTWQRMPPRDDEQAFAQIADWGPAEDWSDWAHASG